MGDFVTSGEKESYLTLDNEFYSAMVQWDSAGEIGGLDNLNIKTIVGRHDLYYDYVHDRDFTPMMIDASGLPPEGAAGGQRRFTNDFEMLFTGDVNDRLGFVAGVHWMEDENTNGENCLDVLRANFDVLFDPNSTASSPCARDGGTQFEYLADKQTLGGAAMTGMGGYIRSESIAAFGHLTYDINDTWTLDVGARWTEDERTYNLVEIATVDGTCTHNQPGDPPITVLCTS
jgi:outer membrane receptor protein involved in Fe transport